MLPFNNPSRHKGGDTALSILNLGVERERVISATPRLLYPLQGELVNCL